MTRATNAPGTIRLLALARANVGITLHELARMAGVDNANALRSLRRRYPEWLAARPTTRKLSANTLRVIEAARADLAPTVSGLAVVCGLDRRNVSRAVRRYCPDWLAAHPLAEREALRLVALQAALHKPRKPRVVARLVCKYRRDGKDWAWIAVQVQRSPVSVRRYWRKWKDVA